MIHAKRILGFCGCVVAVSVTTASALPAILTMEIVEVNGTPIAPTTDIVLQQGDRFVVDLFISDWTPESIGVYQIRFDGDGFRNESPGTINLARFPCATGDDCPVSSDCKGDGFCNCQDSIFVEDREDSLFFSRGAVSAGSCVDSDSITVGAALVSAPTEPDPGIRRYLGTALFSASNDACGEFTLGLNDDTNDRGHFLHTWALTAAQQTIDPIDRSATLGVTIEDGACASVLAVVSATPANCEIDARQPHALNSTFPPSGTSQVLVELSHDPGPIGIGDVEISLTGPGLAPLAVAVGPEGGTTRTITLSNPIPVRAWTTITIITQGGSAATTVGYLPADVNGDGTAAPSDILALIDCLNGVSPFPCTLMNSDVDRDGETGPADILRVIDLLNGAAAFHAYLNAELPPCPTAP